MVWYHYKTTFWDALRDSIHYEEQSVHWTPQTHTISTVKMWSLIKTHNKFWHLKKTLTESDPLGL